ncbi:MAG TPA: PspC domain-containing protein [Acidimicrobiales bacterium]|nr:PspC domain-containing protein [Acidimicrobiales bacterium]
MLRVRNLRRNPNNRVLGGVCSAVSDATGIDVTIVRIATVLISVFSVVFVFIYALAWLFIPMKGSDSTIFSRAITDRRGLAFLAAMIPAVIAIEVVVAILHLSIIFGWLSFPVFLALGALFMIWRNADEHERRWIANSVMPFIGAGRGTATWLLVVRIAAGVAIGLGGVAVLIMGHTTAAALRPVGGAALVLAAFIVVFGPWWLRMIRDLMTERQARAMAEERAAMAAHVHDSVLQTLALIQRNPHDAVQVTRLARAQEHELRAWLFEGKAPGSAAAEATMLAEGVGALQRQVEADHGITVQVVVVGDCPLDSGLHALLDAAKEATVNAAKWSGAEEVSIYAEVEPSTVGVFVRDRGRGFDPAGVPKGRQGITQSIRARVVRCGGTVEIRSAPGEGAEVALTMPRHVLVK